MLVSKEVALKAIKAYTKNNVKGKTTAFLIPIADLKILMDKNPTEGILIHFGEDKHGKLFPIAEAINTEAAPVMALAGDDTPVPDPDPILTGGFPDCPPFVYRTDLKP